MSPRRTLLATLLAVLVLPVADAPALTITFERQEGTWPNGDPRYYSKVTAEGDGVVTLLRPDFARAPLATDFNYPEYPPDLSGPPACYETVFATYHEVQCGFGYGEGASLTLTGGAGQTTVHEVRDFPQASMSLGDGFDVVADAYNFGELFIAGGAGPDHVFLRGQFDTAWVEGGDGNDFLMLAGADCVCFLEGQAGNDTLRSQDASSETGDTDDQIGGGLGEDLITAEPDDRVFGDEDNDVVTIVYDEEDPPAGAPGSGADGGTGDDVFRTNAILPAGGGPPVLSLSLSAGTVSAGSGGTGVVLPAQTYRFNSLWGSHDFPNILVGDDTSNRLIGGADDDQLVGNGGNDLLYDIDGGEDTMEAGDGNDRVVATDGAVDQIDCGPGLDADVQADPEDVLIDCERHVVVIATGPSGLVPSSDARFEFALTETSPPPGHYECRLNEESFSECESPKSYAGLLDGHHRFEVRYVPDAGTVGSPTVREWTIDITAPRAIVTSAPTGDANGSDATIEFTADAPDVAAFECSVDGAAPQGCASPLRLTGLAPGRHTVEIRAIDALGNEQPDSTVVQWGVAEQTHDICASGVATRRFRAAGPLQCVVCPAGTQGRVAFGSVVAISLAASGCFERRTVRGLPAMVAAGPVSVNGIVFTPRSADKPIVVAEGLSGGLVSVEDVLMQIGSLPPIRIGELELDGVGTGGVAAFNKFVELHGTDLLEALGFRFGGSMELELSADNGGQASATFKLVLPKAGFTATPKQGPFKNAGTGVEGLTIELPLAVSHDKGVTGGLKAELGEAWFGPVKVKDLSLGYDHSAGVLAGGATFLLDAKELRSIGDAEPGLKFEFEAPMGTSPTPVLGPFSKLAIVASGIQRMVAQGVFLQRVGGRLERRDDDSAAFTATGGVSLGPAIDLEPIFKGEPISLDGNVSLVFPATTPAFIVELEGVGKIIEIPMANLKLVYKPWLDVTLTGHVEFSALGYGVRAELSDFWLSEHGVNLKARGAARLPGLLEAVLGPSGEFELVASSIGYAACTGDRLAGKRFGFGKRWEQPKLDTFSETCDVGPFELQRPGAQASQADAAHTFDVKRGEGIVSLLVAGSGGPPKVALAGPGGARLGTPDDLQPLDTAQGLIVQDTAASATHIVLRDPAAGRWTVTPQPGGGTVTGLSVARQLPPVKVTGRVKRQGARRALTYRVRNLGRQTITFLERAGKRTQEIGTARRARGRIVFRPLPGKPAARRIEAVVVNGGLPRTTVRVARFTAPPAALRRVAGLRRTARGLRWRGQPGAASYAVAVRLPDGTTLSADTRRPRFPLPASARRARLRVSILPIAPEGRLGPALAKTVKAPKR